MYTEPTYEHPPAPADSIGYGLWGCAAGILAGLLGGGLLLIVVSLVAALTTAIPATAQVDAMPDLRLTISEDTLNQFAQNTAGGPVQLDLLPGNQVNMQADTTMSAFGVTAPVQITGLFGLQITPPASIEVRLIEVNVAGFDLPQDTLTGLFNSPLSMINRDLNTMIENASTRLGVPLVLTGLGTTDTELWLEARTTP
ncbi:MAG: hypothetical protein HYR94_20585 [Chloroflexi bacterium]|nr:hypothetical protein [Chloroflexota bacterium]